jgi:glycosidase
VNTRVDKLPAVLDFPFTRAVVDVASGTAGTDELVKLFRADALYDGGVAGALQLPTFLGNHDAGRFPMLMRMFAPKLDGDELLRRDMLGHAMLLTLRGVPTIYYGDEQGFVGTGGDQQARQDMFPSKVASYNQEKLIGSNSTTAQSNFNPDHPLYRLIGDLARIRTSHRALTRGLQLIRYSSDKPGLFAVSRFDPTDGHEMLLLFNTSTQSVRQHVRVETRSTRFLSSIGTCPAKADAPGTVSVDVRPLGFAVCDAR